MELEYGEYRALLEQVAKCAIVQDRTNADGYFTNSDMTAEQFDQRIAENE